jgi:hypothetical protein
VVIGQNLLGVCGELFLPREHTISVVAYFSMPLKSDPCAFI